MAKKVLRIISRLNIGGPAIHVTNLNYYLDKDHGYDSLLVTGSVGDNEGDMEYLAQEKGLKIYKIPELGRELSFLKDIKTLAELKKIIRQEKPDIVHTHTSKAGTLGRLAAKQCGVKEIYHTFHGHVFHSYFGKLKMQIFMAIEKYLAGFTTKVIAISDKQKEDLVNFKIAPAEKIEVVRLGFELDKLTSSNAKGFLRQKLNGLTGKTRLIGIIGRLAPIKDHQLFIEVAAEFFRKDPGADVRFVIIGDGEERSRLENKVKELKLEQKVLFTGFISEIDKVFDDLDVVILTSKNEGTPVAVVEAMAKRVPVISANVGGVSDLIEDGSTGYLIDDRDENKYAEKIKEVLSSDLEGIKTRAQDFVMKNYDITRLAQDINKLYNT